MFSLSGIKNAILNFIYECFYYIGVFVMKILHYLYAMFEVFTGMKKVTYNGTDSYLLNVFFSNDAISTIYWGMALIGIIMLFVMTILAVYKKMQDLGDRMQMSLGEILRKMFTSFVFIISMQFIMFVSINVVNTLMESVTYLFDNAYSIGQSTEIEFNDEEYAAMARIFNTVGNYSLSKTFASRYNINSCYNDIRADMQYLDSKKVFRYSYEVVVDGESIESWQSILSQIARAGDLSEDQPLDEYNISISAAILDAMEYCKQNNCDMTVLQEYSQDTEKAQESTSDIDVLFWLAATTEAAKNKSYNGEFADFTDPVRNPYRLGSRSIYNLGQVESDYSLAFGKFNHLIVIIGGALLCWVFFQIVIDAASRIFNLMLLYISAPPFIATAPFDDGEKFRQWTNAFIVQTFSVFGTVLSIRLMMLFLPIIFSSNLVILNTGFFGMFAKIMLVMGVAVACGNGSKLFQGILQGNGAGASAQAGEGFNMLKGSAGVAAAGAIGGYLNDKYNENKRDRKEAKREAKAQKNYSGGGNNGSKKADGGQSAGKQQNQGAGKQQNQGAGKQQNQGAGKQQNQGGQNSTDGDASAPNMNFENGQSGSEDGTSGSTLQHGYSRNPSPVNLNSGNGQNSSSRNSSSRNSSSPNSSSPNFSSPNTNFRNGQGLSGVTDEAEGSSSGSDGLSSGKSGGTPVKLNFQTGNSSVDNLNGNNSTGNNSTGNNSTGKTTARTTSTPDLRFRNGGKAYARSRAAEYSSVQGSSAQSTESPKTQIGNSQNSSGGSEKVTSVGTGSSDSRNVNRGNTYNGNTSTRRLTAPNLRYRNGQFDSNSPDSSENGTSVGTGPSDSTAGYSGGRPASHLNYNNYSGPQNSSESEPAGHVGNEYVQSSSVQNSSVQGTSIPDRSFINGQGASGKSSVETVGTGSPSGYTGGSPVSNLNYNNYSSPQNSPESEQVGNVGNEYVQSPSTPDLGFKNGMSEKTAQSSRTVGESVTTAKNPSDPNRKFKNGKQ